MILILISIISAQVDMFEDSFVLVNRLLPEKPLTVFNMDSNDLTMPLRLSEITIERLPTQLFMIRFNYKHDFWLSNIIKKEYRSVNGSPYLITKSNAPDPNLKLGYIGNMEKDRVYKIISENTCMTVGDENTKGEVHYYPLEFKKCTNSPSQEFVFIPRIAAENFLKREKVEKVEKKKLSEAYNKLYSSLKISSLYNQKNEEE